MAVGIKTQTFSQCWLHDHYSLNGIIEITVASTAMSSWEKKQIVRFYMPKLRYNYDAHHSGGLRIIFGHLPWFFNMHPLHRKRHFYIFPPSKSEHLWLGFYPMPLGLVAQCPSHYTTITVTTWQLAFFIPSVIVKCCPILYKVAILVFTKCFSRGRVVSRQAASLPGVS